LPWGSQLDQLSDAETTAVTSRQMFEAERNAYWISVVDFCLAYVRMANGDVAKARLIAAQAKLQFQNLEIKGGHGRKPHAAGLDDAGIDRVEDGRVVHGGGVEAHD
jgi:hypothetical protein